MLRIFNSIRNLHELFSKRMGVGIIIVFQNPQKSWGWEERGNEVYFVNSPQEFCCMPSMDQIQLVHL